MDDHYITVIIQCRTKLAEFYSANFEFQRQFSVSLVQSLPSSFQTPASPRGTGKVTSFNMMALSWTAGSPEAVAVAVSNIPLQQLLLLVPEIALGSPGKT